MSYFFSYLGFPEEAMEAQRGIVKGRVKLEVWSWPLDSHLPDKIKITPWRS